MIAMDKTKQWALARHRSIIIGYFFICSATIALFLRFGIAPDEGIHFGIIKYYAQNSLDPVIGAQHSDYYLGALARDPSYLYHYLLSFPYRLFELLHINTLIGLRILNVLMGCATIYGLFWIADQLRLKKSISGPVVLALASIPIFMFLSSALNYDNLLLLIVVYSIGISIGLKQRFSVNGLLILTLLLVLGPLVKFAFLPYSAVLGFYVLSLTVVQKKKIFQQLARKKPVSMILIVACIIGLGLFGERYMRNIIEYKSITPECTQTLTEDQCQQNFVYKRTMIYRNASLEKPDMKIDVYMVNWIRIMTDRTYGLLGHRTFKSKTIIFVSGLVLIYSLILAAIFSLRDAVKKYWFIPVSSIAYLLGLVITNIKYYRESQNIGLAVQGRYWLPVLLTYTVYLAWLYRKKLQKYPGFIAILCIIWSIIAGPLYIILGTHGNGWFHPL